VKSRRHVDVHGGPGERGGSDACGEVHAHIWDRCTGLACSGSAADRHGGWWRAITPDDAPTGQPALDRGSLTIIAVPTRARPPEVPGY
jgi:hypothetical protein